MDIIIGNDFYGQLITKKIIKTENEALIAIESKFGWLLSGPVQNENNKRKRLKHSVKKDRNDASRRVKT